MSALFGPAGNAENFPYKSSVDAPRWLREIGLDCYEYQCGKGVHVGKETAVKIGENARAAGIVMSLHAPYFINLANPDRDALQKTIGYITAGCQVADWMGARRVVIHSGALMKRSRGQALETAKKSLAEVIAACDGQGFSHITLCPETMGKINQLGGLDEVLELFMELDANDDQLDSPFVFASARGGYASKEAGAREGDMKPLFEAIIQHIPAPKGDPDAPLQALISTIDYSEYVGRIGIGKIENGTIHVNDEVVVLNMHNADTRKKLRITKLYVFNGLQRVEVKEAGVGNIVALSGIENIMIGDTICSPEKPEALPFVKISEPTLSMNFLVNDSPFAGTEGKFVTSRHLRDRLYKELNTDVSLRVEDTESMDCIKVSGRGELHLSILIETLRREGYEFQVSKPEVLFREIDGKKCEPMEAVTIDVPEDFVGSVIEKLGGRKGELRNMYPSKGGYTRLEFSIPARGLIGYRGEFMTDTKGNGILNSVFDDYEPYKGDIPTRSQGSLVAFESGEAITYGLYNAQERGDLFIGAGVKVYEGMVVGRNARADDMDINVCKKKQLTNIRSSSSDESLRLTPPIQMSLEQCMEFISEDELLEVTPQSLRMRKKILDNNLRRKHRIHGGN